MGHGYARTSAVIGVSLRQFERWRHDDPEFAEQCREARERAIDLIENQLYNAALDGDTLSQLAYLRAHRPQLYHRRQLVQVGGEVDVNHRATHIELDEHGKPMEVINNVQTVKFRLPDNRRNQPEVYDAKAEPPVIDATAEDAA
jgi:hypothetical protein